MKTNIPFYLSILQWYLTLLSCEEPESNLYDRKRNQRELDF